MWKDRVVTEVDHQACTVLILQLIARFQRDPESLVGNDCAGTEEWGMEHVGSLRFQNWIAVMNRWRGVTDHVRQICSGQFCKRRVRLLSSRAHYPWIVSYTTLTTKPFHSSARRTSSYTSFSNSGGRSKRSPVFGTSADPQNTSLRVSPSICICKRRLPLL